MLVNEEQSTPNTTINSQDRPQGCGLVILLIVIALWVIFSTVFISMSGWFVEQFMFEGSFKLPDAARWGFGAAASLSVLLPCLLLKLLVRQTIYRAIFTTWLCSSIFALLVIPGRLLAITSAQLAAVVQIIGILVYIAALGLWIRRNRRSCPPGWYSIHPAGLGLGLLPAALLLLPWVMWGALGSLLDIFLALMTGLLTGLAMVMTLGAFLYPITLERPGYRGRDFLRDSVTAGLTMLIMAAGLGESGNQWLLLAVAPLTGWLLTAVLFIGRNGQMRLNWLSGMLLCGLTLAWPLLWFDADELMLVTSMGSGEALQWAGLAVLVAIILQFLLALIFTILKRALQKPGGYRRLVLILAFSILLLSTGIYVFFGHPGLFGERMFIVLKDQADVSSAANINVYSERRAYVYQTLVSQANKSQAGLRRDLANLGIAYKPYYLVNAIEVTGSPFVRLWLLSRPEVDRILDSPVLRPLPAIPPAASGSEDAPDQPDWNLTMIGATKVKDLMGITGQGIVIGQSDSGVQGSHPQLMSSYRGLREGGDYNWFDPWNHTLSPTDIGGHGTHTLGTIVGQKTGVAPGASWIGCVNLARNLGNPAVYLDCWQFMLAPFALGGDPFTGGDPDRGAHVLNNSWGCPTVEGCDPATYLPAVKALKAAGIFVVVSAGNSGTNGCGSISDPPAVYDEVLTVGAVNRFGQLADFSSLGPVTVDGSQRIKPDITAPGENVLSSFPNSTYAKNSGTSMAGPHATGVVALMWSANPALIGKIDETRQIIIKTATKYTGKMPACTAGSETPNNAVGYGILNALEAVKAAREYKSTP
jgi:subtilisin family serine protease